MLQSRAQIAVDYYVKYGYNCSQAVAVTYADLLGLDPMVCFKGMETFGSGMGARLGTCGAISGAIYLAGFVTSTGHMDEDRTNKSKKASYDLAGKITQAFHSCLDCIADAAILAETYIFPGQFEEPTYYKEKGTR